MLFQYDCDNDEYNEICSSVGSVMSDVRYIHRRSSISSSKYSTTSLSRIIGKSGRLNIFHIKIPKKYFTYFLDLGNTLLNIRWRWIITALFFVNFLSFFIFGLLWMFIAYISGDFEKDSRIACIVNTRSLTGYFLLSVETMLTIGYGYRYPTENCIQGWIVPFLQALISVGIQGALVSAIYVKISKPVTHNNLGFFGKKAVIQLRDGKLCLVIRITDLLGKIAIGTNVKLYFIRKDTQTFGIQQMKTEAYGFPIFPMEVIHVINPHSPLWDLTPQELLVNPIEIIAVAEGTSIITGQPSQNRTSYVNCDILWGHRFASCVCFDNKREKYIINYKSIDDVYAFATPLCSARSLDLIAKNNFLE